MAQANPRMLHLCAVTVLSQKSRSSAATSLLQSPDINLKRPSWMAGTTTPSRWFQPLGQPHLKASAPAAAVVAAVAPRAEAAVVVDGVLLLHQLLRKISSAARWIFSTSPIWWRRSTTPIPTEPISWAIPPAAARSGISVKNIPSDGPHSLRAQGL